MQKPPKRRDFNAFGLNFVDMWCRLFFVLHALHFFVSHLEPLHVVYCVSDSHKGVMILAIKQIALLFRIGSICLIMTPIVDRTGRRHLIKKIGSRWLHVAYCACYCSISYNSVFNCPGAETTTLEITDKLKISATTLCDERNKYILAESFTFTPHRQKSRTLRAH